MANVPRFLYFLVWCGAVWGDRFIITPSEFFKEKGTFYSALVIYNCSLDIFYLEMYYWWYSTVTIIYDLAISHILILLFHILISNNFPYFFRRDLDPNCIPVSESLQDTMERTLPLLAKRIIPDIKLGKTVLVVAHANSLRGATVFFVELVNCHSFLSWLIELIVTDLFMLLSEY